MESQDNTGWFYEETHSLGFVTLHSGLSTFTIMESQDNTTGFMNIHIHVCLTFHHGLLTFTIM